MQKHYISLGDNSKGIVCQAVIENMLFKCHTICLYFSAKIVKATQKTHMLQSSRNHVHITVNAVPNAVFKENAIQRFKNKINDNNFHKHLQKHLLTFSNTTDFHLDVFALLGK